MRSKSTDKKDMDKNSLSFIWITVIATVSIAVFISMRSYFPLFADPQFRYIGPVVIFAGVILRLAAIATLGRFFTVDVTIRQGHQIKKDGLYRYLRHPSYFASLLSFIGLGISLDNWISLLLITVSILIVFIMRIKIEEKMLIEHFGVDYMEYKRNTKGIIPFIY